MSLDDAPEDVSGRVAVELPPDPEGQGLVPAQPMALATVDRLLATAVANDISVDALEKLLGLHERMQATAARAAYAEALSAFQADCPVIPKTKSANAGNYSYKYAPLDVIVSTVGPILRAHGLSYRFDTAFEATEYGQAQVVRCIVQHRDGHSEASEFRTPTDAGARMNDMQKSASAQTYAKRYAFCNALGILTGDEDNDGHGSSGAGRSNVPRPVDGDRRAPAGAAPASVATTPSGGPAGGATPRPLGRNLVKIPRPQGPQDSDGQPFLQDVGTFHTVAETPAVPEGSVNESESAQVQAREMAEAEKAELRVRIIKGQAALLRTMTKYKDFTEDDLWNRAGEVVDQWTMSVAGFQVPLVELNREQLRRAAAKMDETVVQRTGNAA